jgi:hypothetical protein
MSIFELKNSALQMRATAPRPAATAKEALAPASEPHPLALLSPLAHIMSGPTPAKQPKAEALGETLRLSGQLVTKADRFQGATAAVDLLKERGQPVPQQLGMHTLAETRAQAGGRSSQGANDTSMVPQTEQQKQYQALWPSLIATGVSDHQEDARDKAAKVLGYGDDQHGQAVYGLPGGIMDDLAAVSTFGHGADLVRIDDNGRISYKTDGNNAFWDLPSKTAMEGLSNGQKVGQEGADRLTSQMKDPSDKGQFISLTGHSGGGQSCFYTALQLYQQGYRNVSLVGYDMALTARERDMLDQMGVQVTNVTGYNETGHTSNTGNYIQKAENPTEGKYYDLAVSRPREEVDLQASTLARGALPFKLPSLPELPSLPPMEMHDLLPKTAEHPGKDGKIDSPQVVANKERTIATLQFATWLDSQGLHGQYDQQNLDTWKAATGYVPPVNPLDGLKQSPHDIHHGGIL